MATYQRAFAAAAALCRVLLSGEASIVFSTLRRQTSYTITYHACIECLLNVLECQEDKRKSIQTFSFFSVVLDLGLEVEMTKRRWPGGEQQNKQKRKKKKKERIKINRK